VISNLVYVLNIALHLLLIWYVLHCFYVFAIAVKHQEKVGFWNGIITRFAVYAFALGKVFAVGAAIFLLKMLHSIYLNG